MKVLGILGTFAILAGLAGPLHAACPITMQYQQQLAYTQGGYLNPLQIQQFQAACLGESQSSGGYGGGYGGDYSADDNCYGGYGNGLPLHRKDCNNLRILKGVVDLFSN